MRIKEGDEWMAACPTHIGSYKLTVMYFGLTNSPATFQTMMNNLFRDMVLWFALDRPSDIRGHQLSLMDGHGS